MWKVYAFAALAFILLGLAIASVMAGNYWQFVSELLGGLLSVFVAIGTSSDSKK
ncbi:hypothetical protein [uncultured Secundilactobacillus sp.]|uniref:hypothetical protein n=1 Tax=uncultured Secundilactobacillus sp. TaxID=2813935 RepID=UPI00258BF91C|nr:hypothetical protein [uncultured Secundilactobacillus sp.]